MPACAHHHHSPPRPTAAPAVEVPKTKICEKTLDDADVSDFALAIDRQYWFELFMDDLPMWGYVGEAKRAEKEGEKDVLLLYPHWQLDISYNGDQVRRRWDKSEQRLVTAVD